MTTHDQQIAVDPTTNVEPQFSSTRTEAPVSQTEPAAQNDPALAEPAQADPALTEPAQADPAHAEPAQADPALAEPAQADSAQTPPVQTMTEAHSAEVQPSDEELLFAADLSGLRSRWDDIQAAFVDDPADCVQKADSLVTEVVEQLTTAFSEARSRLETQWARGEQASTEDLRLALTRYREFFQRLLAV
jgi:hypothetical protein